MFTYRKLLLSLLLIAPMAALAQGIPEEIRGLHDTLDTMFDEMLELCKSLIDASRIIAGFAAVFYIGYRVWRHIANAEPVDFMPITRPFVLAWCITFFPQVIALTNGILSPTTASTQEMVDDSNATVARLIEKRQEEMKDSKSYKMYGVNDGEGDREVWMKYTHSEEVDDEGLFGGISNSMEFTMSKAYYNLKNWFKDLLSFLLQLLYEAAALCINTLRTFNLLICALLGPFVFAISVFDGFQHSLTVWLARYINYYLWLPIANVLGSLLNKIQEKMIEIDIQQVEEYGDSFFTTSDVGYIIFMLIGIVAYFTVPSMANMIVNAGGGSILTTKISNYAMGSMSAMASGPAAAAAGAGMMADSFGNQNRSMSSGGGFGRTGDKGDWFRDQLSG